MAAQDRIHFLFNVAAIVNTTQTHQAKIWYQITHLPEKGQKGEKIEKLSKREFIDTRTSEKPVINVQHKKASIVVLQQSQAVITA